MTIRINKDKCLFCKKCLNICPGNLLIEKSGEIFIRDRSSCWDCASCMKECPFEAIEMFIDDPSLGVMTSKVNGDEVCWKIDLNGEVKEYKTSRKESNEY